MRATTNAGNKGCQEWNVSDVSTACHCFDIPVNILQILND